MIDVVRFASEPVESIMVQRGEGNTRKIRGVASVYYNGSPGTEYEIGEGIVERIAVGAFDGLLQGDTIAAVNHDASQIVGRTPGTLKLWTSSRGLEYEIDLPNTTTANDLWENVTRGLINGSSFKASINLNDKSMVDWQRDGERDVLVIKRFARLKDVSPVTEPAYKGTECGAIQRSLEEHKAFAETLKRIARAKSLVY